MSNDLFAPISPNHPRDISAPEGLVVPSASQAWQNGHRSRNEGPYRRPSLISDGSTDGSANLTASNSTPHRPSSSTAHSRQSSSILSIASQPSTSVDSLLAPGTAFPLPIRQLRQDEGYYASIRTSEIAISSRRTTSDGRTKLKLDLLGMRVERCGVCLMQFREGDVGAKTICEHV